MNNFDFNNAEPQNNPFELIPANTFCKVNLVIRPGIGASDEWLKPSKSSDAEMLDCEFTVLEGPYAKKKFWTNMVVSGGKTNDQGQSIAGNITRSNLRAILESSRNINPDDMSEEAMTKRILTGYGDFHLMEFAIKVGIEKDKTGNYPDKNRIMAVVTPNKKEYAGIMAGTYQNAAPKQTAPTPTAPPWKQGAGQPANNPNQPAPPTGQPNTPPWAKGGAAQ